MDKFARICFCIGLLGALFCFIIIEYFLSNSDMTTGELLSTALSTMDTFNKVTGVTVIVIGIIRTCMSWMMLLLQAGAIAEQRLTGREGLGASNDSARWLTCARIYLANLCDDTIYYAEPDNEQEQAHNVRELNALKQRQRALLATFFALNDAVLRDLSATAQEKRTLRRDDLLPFFARVQFPDSFPRPDLAVLTEG